MRKFVSFIVSFVFIVSLIFSQSRPQLPTDSTKKNKRPAKTQTVEKIETPLPPQYEESPTVTDDEILKVETNLVTVPVKVLDRKGKFVPNLKKEDFQIFEDGVEQEIAYFSYVEEPFTVVLMLDMSYSTFFKTTEIQSAAIGFTAQLRPKDKVMVVSFDDKVRLHCQPTTDRNISNTAIKQTQIGQGTSLYDAVDYVIKQLKTIQGRKAIILFTDGVDTTSEKAFYEDNLRNIEELDALVYPIQYDTFADVQRAGIPTIINPTGKPTPNNLPIPLPDPKTLPIPRRTRQPYPTPTNDPFPTPTSTPKISFPNGDSEEEYLKADEFLRQIAMRTGGDVYQATDKASMALSFSRIADELRQQYSLGFYPVEGIEGKKRRLKVKVNMVKVSVRSRESYIFGKKTSKK